MDLEPLTVLLTEQEMEQKLAHLLDAVLALEKEMVLDQQLAQMLVMELEMELVQV
jgi:hypothetical protein